MVEPIHTSWSIANEADKAYTVKWIVQLSKKPAWVEYAREKAQLLTKEWPELPGLLKAEIERTKLG